VLTLILTELIQLTLSPLVTAMSSQQPAGSVNQGRQSPPPERQTGAQLNSAPASGKGAESHNAQGTEQSNKDALQVRSPSGQSAIK